MPRPGKRWRHLVVSTRNSWLKGDPRGFRTRYHQLHSSGDYRNPPPDGEHSGLHHYFRERVGNEVHIGYPERAIIGRGLVRAFHEMGCRILCIAVSKVHAHALVEMVDYVPTIKRQMGEAKRHSSRAVKATMPGKVWAVGGRYGPVDTRAHCRATFDYILYTQGAGAWTWSYRDGNLDGVYGRARPDPRRGKNRQRPSD